MRLDATDLRFVTQEEFKVLSAVEVGSRNHEVVPTPLIAELSSIRSGIVTKCLSSLSKRKLVARVQGAKYDGYRLTYGGLDYLALKTFSRRKPATVAGVGTKIGVGKESDIHLVQDEAGKERVLKMHRLGRISFRAIKEKRDYLGNRKSASWMYLSRLAAQKEYEFMKILYNNGFPVPVPIDQARHCIVMSLIDAYPLRQVDDVPSPSTLYATLMALILRLAHCGLIHGDYNEFNILIHRKTGEPTLIDFPQMVSTRHPNAEFFFDRDVEGIKRFFKRRFRFEPSSWPRWKDVLAGPDLSETGGADTEQKAESSQMALYPRLDEQVEASGWNSKGSQQLEEYFASIADIPEEEWDGDDDDDDDGDDNDEDDNEERVDGEAVWGSGQTAEEVEDARDASSDRSHEQDPSSEDEEARTRKTAARLEQLRLNRALGNDEPEDIALDPEAVKNNSARDDSTEEESGEGESEEDPENGEETLQSSAKSGGVRNSRPRPADKGWKQGGIKDRLEREIRGTKTGPGSGEGRVKAGKAKGHKWKSSEKYLVDKNSGW
ncbi:RIO1 family-domain-containing protein [Kockovaella imperatae]|uniref:Serine/threonine-protein kinase RIO2 n=1 Tax=Kockovaella imperatae TaxID=4999 RepID=A0A1Y1UTK5_9TREE|nr:RIO1 family-domain-containing protein [Kockovaella imperatae]ORX40854.1 RIO1 family-domain-containing protein [Kockovaella imperatae]